jgi:hypothetical protein
VNGTKEKLGVMMVPGIPGGVNDPKAPGTVGAVGVPKPVNVPEVEKPGIAGGLGIGKAPMIVPLVKLVMPGIGGRVAVKLEVNRFVKTNCKLLVSSTPRREEVAVFCCSITIREERKTRKI